MLSNKTEVNVNKSVYISLLINISEDDNFIVYLPVDVTCVGQREKNKITTYANSARMVNTIG